jgi:hypothetical protein
MAAHLAIEIYTQMRMAVILHLAGTVSSLDQTVPLAALSAAAAKSRTRMDRGLAVELKLA